MPVTLELPNVLVALADGQRSIALTAGTVGEALEAAATRFPRLAPRLRTEDGAPYPFVTYYLNDEDIRLAGGFATPVRDGDEITIVPAIAGG